MGLIIDGNGNTVERGGSVRFGVGTGAEFDGTAIKMGVVGGKIRIEVRTPLGGTWHCLPSTVYAKVD